MAFNFNPNNNGNATGRLAKDPVQFTNAKDGSTTVLFTVMADRNYTDKNTGQVPSDAVPISAWVAPGKSVNETVFGYMHRGDQVKIDYAVRSSEPYQKNGETIYPPIQLAPEFVTLLEPKSVTQARLAKRLAETEAKNQAALPTEVPTSAPIEQAPVAAQETAPVAAQPVAAQPATAVVGNPFAQSGDDQPPF